MANGCDESDVRGYVINANDSDCEDILKQVYADGSQPVNLFTTAQGLLGTIGSGPSNPAEEED